MSKIIDAIFPMIANYRMNNIVREKMHPKDETGKDIEPKGALAYVENSERLSLDAIKAQYDDTFSAKEKLEDKAKTNIIGVTISITLIMGASGMLSALNKKYPFPVLSWILFLLFIFSVAYMLFAGILVIRLLTNENEVYIVKLDSLASDDATLRDDYDKCIAQNRDKNTIRNNYVFTSYECIRNSLICLFIILIFIAIPIESLSQHTDSEFLYPSQSYSFMYSSSVIDYVEDSKVRTSVENAIICAIDSIEISNAPQTLGIVDNSNYLFIKFNIIEKSVEVILIEPFTPI